MDKSKSCIYGPCGRCEFNDCFDGGTCEMYDPEYNYFDNDEEEEDLYE